MAALTSLRLPEANPAWGHMVTDGGAGDLIESYGPVGFNRPVNVESDRIHRLELIIEMTRTK